MTTNQEERKNVKMKMDPAVHHDHHQGRNVKMERKEANQDVQRRMVETMITTKEVPRKTVKMMSNRLN
jgi:hypothetical protein